jgi:hypothetical protein
MDRSGNPMGRRKFLKKGLMSSVLFFVFPPKRVVHSGTLHQKTHSQRLLQIVRQYGGEFGAFKGGL